jgi:hypothetical protein
MFIALHPRFFAALGFVAALEEEEANNYYLEDLVKDLADREEKFRARNGDGLGKGRKAESTSCRGGSSTWGGQPTRSPGAARRRQEKTQICAQSAPAALLRGCTMRKGRLTRITGAARRQQEATQICAQSAPAASLRGCTTRKGRLTRSQGAA